MPAKTEALLDETGAARTMVSEVHLVFSHFCGLRAKAEVLLAKKGGSVDSGASAPVVGCCLVMVSWLGEQPAAEALLGETGPSTESGACALV